MEKSRDWRKLLGFAYCCFVVVALAGMFFISGKDLGETNPANKTYADFVGYYRSAKMVLSEDRNKIYDRETQLKYFNQLQAAQQSEQFIYSQNPPSFLVMLAPFAMMPINISFKVWIALSILLPGIANFFLMKHLHNTKLATSMLFVLAALLSAPGWICVFVGQMSWFIALFITMFCLGFLSKNDALTGIALALATGKFQYVFVLGIPLLACRRWRAIGWACGAELLMLALSALVIGANNVLGYPSILFNAETTKDYIGVFPEYMISLRGLLSLFLDRHAALVGSSAIMFVSLIPLFLFWWNENKSSSPRGSAWGLALTICAALLVSAHTHIYDDVLLLVVASLTLPYFWRSAENRIPDVPGAIWQTVLYAFPVASWIIFITCSNVDAIKRTPFAVINLLLLAIAFLIYRRKQPGPT